MPAPLRVGLKGKTSGEEIPHELVADEDEVIHHAVKWAKKNKPEGDGKAIENWLRGVSV